MSQKPLESNSSVSPEETQNTIKKYLKELVSRQKLVKSTPSEVERCIDLLIPRGGKVPEGVFVSLEEYLSRLSLLHRKILGVEHRQEQWDKVVASHLAQFNHLVEEWPATEYVKNTRVTSNFSLRSVRVENEFEVLLFSVCSTLTILTKVIAAFLSESRRLHSYSKLPKVLSGKTGWDSLEKIIEKAHTQWAREVIQRRDDATHYVALTAQSLFRGKDKESPLTIRVAIPKAPEGFVSIWLDDVPAAGGTIVMSSSITEDDGTAISEAYEIYDMDGRLLVKRASPLQLSPVIDGREYVNETIKHLDQHIIDVLRELYGKISHSNFNSLAH